MSSSSFARATVSVSVSATVPISQAHPIATHELAHACGASIEWVVQLVEVGIVDARAVVGSPEVWRFQSVDLQNALEARCLERNFGAAAVKSLSRTERRVQLDGAQQITRSRP